MWKLVRLLLLPLALLSQELEVHLPTRSSLKPLYLSFKGQADELRSVLEADLQAGGFCTVLSERPFLEETLRSLKSRIDFPALKKERVCFCLLGSISGSRLTLTAYNVEEGTSKTYPPVPLERKAIHRLSDALHKDLFGSEGIASLRLIYTQRKKSENHNGLKWLSEVWVCDIDGTNAKQITSENSYCLCPYFLPFQKDQFFYVSEKSGQSKIYKASFDNPKGELMVDLRGNQALPGLSKNCSQIAFITDIAGRPDLFTQNLNANGLPVGKPKQLFSAPRATQATPTYSPDGKQIAFVSDKDGPPRIYVMSAAARDAQKPKLLTKKNRENTSPSWSPDGTKLAYSAKVDGVRQIWIYDFATEEETQLTTGPKNKENPSWAPDSFHLVYNTESEEECELYLTHLNGCDPIQILKTQGQKRFASWEPR